MREVELFVEPQSAEELLRLLIHLVLVLADEELHKVTKGRVDELLLPVGLLVVLDLLLADLFDLFHVLGQELILVRLRQALCGLLKECLAHPIVLFLVSPGNVALNLSEVLSKRFEAEDLLLSFSQLRFLLELVDLLEKELASYTALFGVVTQVSKAILDLGGVFNDSRSIIKLSLQDLREHLVDVVWVSTFDSDT